MRIHAYYTIEDRVVGGRDSEEGGGANVLPEE